MNKSTTTLHSYVMGYVLSLILTLVAYFLVKEQALQGWVLVATIVALAIEQLCAQLVLFLHLGREPRPRWQLLSFGFMLVVLFILVLGTLWIMSNLNYHTMTPSQTNQYIQNEELIDR